MNEQPTLNFDGKHSRNAQASRILDYLKAGHRITPLEALNMFGCFRLGARVWELKKQGYNIVPETIEMNGKRFAQYRLEA